MRCASTAGVRHGPVGSSASGNPPQHHPRKSDRHTCCARRERSTSRFYDKVKTEIKNEIGKATAKRKVVLTFEEKLAGLRDQMTPEIRASLQEEAMKAGERRNWRTPEEAKEEVLFSAFKNF